MRVVFLGTPQFACASLEALVAAGHEIPLVVTQPAKPQGRGRSTRQTPVDMRATQLGLPVCALEKGQRAAVYDRILRSAADVAVVVAFGHLIREPLLFGLPLGCVNVHASLLPRWRGAAPIQRAIMAGDDVSGVTTMRLAEGLDTGPIYLQEATPIGIDETSSQLHDRLALLGAALLLRTLAGLDDGTLLAASQPESGVTWAAPLRKEEGTVDFQWDARRVHDTVRALEAWPKVAVEHAGRRLFLGGSVLRREERAQGARRAAPGTVVALGPGQLAVACGLGTALLSRVLPAGGRWMDPASYARGRGLRVGDRLVPATFESAP